MVCPAIEAEKSQFKDTIFMDYVFHHPTNDNHYVMSLGLCAMANHSEDPNCEWTVETPPGEPPDVVIRAKRPIEKHEEITVSYGENYWESRNIQPS